MQLLEDAQDEDERRDRHAADLLAVAGAVEDGLVVLLHRRVFLRADVELRRHDVLRIRHRVPDRVVEVVDVHELVAVLAAADHREAVARVGPVVEQREDAEALRADEALRTDDRDAEAFLDRLTADVLRVDLGVSVGPDADHRVGLVDRVLLRDAVDGRRGDLDHAVELELARGVQHVTATIDLRRTNILLTIKGKCRGAMHHHIAPFRHLLNRRDITHIAERELQPRLLLLRIIKVRNIKYADFFDALRAKVTNQIDAQKP